MWDEDVQELYPGVALVIPEHDRFVHDTGESPDLCLNDWSVEVGYWGPAVGLLHSLWSDNRSHTGCLCKE